MHITFNAEQHGMGPQHACSEYRGLCAQEEMPVRPARRSGMLGLRVRPTSASARGWRPSRRLCTLLSDLREARCRQAELGAALRGCLPDSWWGAPVGLRLLLGDRFRLCQACTWLQDAGLNITHQLQDTVDMSCHLTHRSSNLER